jgi:hypothetical protein
MATRHMSSRPAAALAWGAGTFVAMQALLASILLCWWPPLRDPWYGAKLNQLRRRIAEGTERPGVVMLGSSRTLNGFNAALIERQLANAGGPPATVYNFGMPGASSLAELVLLRRLLADGARPDVLLVEVSPCFMTRPVDRGMFQAHRLWRRELSLVADFLGNGDALLREWWRGRWVPCHTHREAILYTVWPAMIAKPSFGPWFKQFDPAGWERFDARGFGADFRRRALEHTRSELSGAAAQEHVNDECLGALTQLVETCRREQIRLALVMLPIEAAFRGDNRWVAEVEVETLLARFRDEHGIEMVDARDWLADDEIFDSYHVSSEGADRFSERLTRQALVPQLRQTQIARHGNENVLR